MARGPGFGALGKNFIIVDTEQVTSAGEHAMNLSIGRVFLREKHYAELAHDSVEGSVRERKRGQRRQEGYLFAGPELRPRHPKHWSVEISCRQMHAGRQKIA